MDPITTILPKSRAKTPFESWWSLKNWKKEVKNSGLKPNNPFKPLTDNEGVWLKLNIALAKGV